MSSIGQQPPSLGNQMSNMGQHPPNMGQPSSNMGQPPPNIGQHPPNMGQHPPNMGQPPSNMGQHPPNMGQTPSNISQNPPNMGQHPPNMGQHPSNMGPSHGQILNPQAASQSHMNQMNPQSMQGSYPLRSGAINPGMMGPASHNQPNLSQQPHSNVPSSSNNGSSSSLPQMAPQGSVQKMLDENNQFIQLLLDYQAKGRHHECAEYQRLLHRNLVYLATVADASNQNVQSSANSSGIPLSPKTAPGGGSSLTSQ
ncbi:SS18L1 [Bugula neritina]|uniref:SS18L1 n=1 Tax=Bugula neritina TaxID=10212 RepID=A0A7J7J882_BUGNE|nr:SS18L1 [Bugula neritina]